jgi:hypothetical protein
MLCGSSLLYFVVDGFLSFFLWSMSVFRLFTASDYPFDNFKLFSNWFFFVVKTPGISVVFVLPNMYVLGVMSCGSLFVFVVVLFLVSYCIVIVLLLYCYCIVCPSPRFTTSDYSFELVSHSFFLWSTPYYFIFLILSVMLDWLYVMLDWLYSIFMLTLPVVTCVQKSSPFEINLFRSRTTSICIFLQSTKLSIQFINAVVTYGMSFRCTQVST